MGSLLVKLGSRMQSGGAFADAFAAAPCLKHASLSRSDKSLVLASTRGHLGIAEVAQHMRRLFGPSGGGWRHDILSVDDDGKEELHPAGGEDFGARMAYRTAQ